MALRFAFIKFLLLFVSVLPASLTWGQAYCVKKDKTELKVAPQKSATTPVLVDRFTPLQGTGKAESGWVEVTDFEKEKFWVQRKSVTTAYKCLVVRRKSTKLRTGPGKEFPLAEKSTAEKSEPFKDLSGEDGWSRVEGAEGKSGWVDLNHVWQPINHRFRMSFENEE